MKEREKFGSRLGFILVSAGCAIGIGNVWKFPYITGIYGGAAFILMYLVFLVALGLPIMVCEFTVGRGSRMGMGKALDTLEPKGTKWHHMKWISIFGSFLLMMFYTMVGGWMLIEWNKLNFRQRDNNLSHLYAMFSVDWDRATDRPTGRVSYEGAVSLKKLRAGCQTTHVLRKGDILPGTHAVLQADNYGIQFRDLYKHLNHLVAYLTEQEPPKSITDNFQNPYTGQTTAQILAVSQPEKIEVEATREKMSGGQETDVFAAIASWFKKLLGK